MSTSNLTSVINLIIDDAKTAVLATVDTHGNPQMRWITPGTIPDFPTSIFIITADNFAKVAQAKKNPCASILLQTRLLDKVVHLEGAISVIENPSFRSELLERVGKRLNAFWKIDVPHRELVALEFSISHAVLYLPQKGSREVIEIGRR